MGITIALAVLALTPAQEAEVQTAARLIADNDLAVGYPLVVERFYGDYKPQGDQSSPTCQEVWYYATPEDRAKAATQAEPLAQAFQRELGDGILVGEVGPPCLVPRSAVERLGSPFTIHLLRPMVEASGADFDEIGDRLFEHLIV